mgnify:CR=1 FL=1
MDEDEFDDILGTSEPDEDLDFATGGKDFHRTLAVTRVDSVRKGAPAEWFAKLLGIGRTTVNRKIPDTVDPIHVTVKGTRYYRPSDVLPYLVQPHDIRDQIKRMNPKDLPERLRKEFWGARKLEQDVRLRSGDLWLTSDVHRVLGDLMKIIKDTVMLWTDEIDEAVGLTPQQVDILDHLSRKLLADYAAAISQYVEQGVTRSQEAELDEDDDEDA